MDYIITRSEVTVEAFYNLPPSQEFTITYQGKQVRVTHVRATLIGREAKASITIRPAGQGNFYLKANGEVGKASANVSHRHLSTDDLGEYVHSQIVYHLQDLQHALLRQQLISTEVSS